MKLISKLFITSIVFFAFLSCSSDDDSSSSSGTSFSINSETFNMIEGSGLIRIDMDNIWGENIDRTSFTVNGINGQTRVGSVAFDLYRNDTETVAGTYAIMDSPDADQNVIDYLQTHDRVCVGWTSMATIFSGTNLELSCNNPMASETITVVDNGNNSYSIMYNGNFRVYDDNFDVVESIPVSVDISATAVTQ